MKWRGSIGRNVGLLIVVMMSAMSIAAAQQLFQTASTVAGDSIDLQPGLLSYLEPNRPNPFQVQTEIAYTLSERTPVVLTVYDFFYGEVVTLVNRTEDPGRHIVPFFPTESVIASGMYFYVLRTNQGVDQRRMYYVK